MTPIYYVRNIHYESRSVHLTKPDALLTRSIDEVRITGTSASHLLSKIIEHLDAELSEVELDDWDHDRSRLVITQMQNEHDQRAGSDDLREWRLGQKRLAEVKHTVYCKREESVDMSSALESLTKPTPMKGNQ